MKIELRPYQRAFIDAVRRAFHDKKKRVVGVAPCGAGKTIMTGWMIRESLNKGKRSIFFVHRKELIEQTAKTFYELEIPFGIITAGAPILLERPVQIASVQTLARRVIDKNGELNRKIVDALVPDFLICDECHHILASTYKKVLNAFPKAYLLGVTATPLRMGGVTLADAFDSMVQSVTVDELTTLGNLAHFRYFAPTSDIDLSNVKIVHGDYNNRELEDVMSTKAVVGDIVSNYRKLADGKSAICYCVNVNHSQTVADAFDEAGIPAAHCDGETPAAARAEIVSAFRRGRIKVLCNAELFGEGFDVPACQAVILARPTQSLTLFIQQAMRPLRPDPNDPNKVAVIIDHVQNYLRHGLPNDERAWSLDPNIKKFVPCPKCGRMVVPEKKPFVVDGEVKEMRRFCPRCGYMFEKGAAPPASGRHVINSEGDLIEIAVNYNARPACTPVVVKKKPSKLDDIIAHFLAVAKKKGHNPRWAAYQAIGYARSYNDCLRIARACDCKDGWAYYQWQDISSNRLAASERT